MLARWLRPVSVLLAAAGLGYLVISYGLCASALWNGEPELALRLRPHSTQALSMSAERALARNEVTKAMRLARAALAGAPREVRALRVMGIAASLNGNPKLGSELLLRAGTLSWRDEETQVWLIRAALDQRNFATAAQRIDAMLRTGRLDKEMLSLAHDVVRMPEARAALIERLAEWPQWRRDFFADMKTMPPGTEVGHALLIRELAAREGPLPRNEVAGFVGHLIDQGNVTLARQVWLATLDAPAKERLAAVYDGDFRDDPSAESAQPRFPFEWQLTSSDGAVASIGTPPLQVDETALNLRSGDRQQTLASQVVVLAAGRHLLAYDTIMGSDLAPERFQWRIDCVGRGGTLTLGEPAVRSLGTWRSVALPFEVPTQDCAAQRLMVISLNAGSSSAEAWFDHVRIQ